MSSCCLRLLMHVGVSIIVNLTFAATSGSGVLAAGFEIPCSGGAGTTVTISSTDAPAGDVTLTDCNPLLSIVEFTVALRSLAIRESTVQARMQTLAGIEAGATVDALNTRFEQAGSLQFDQSNLTTATVTLRNVTWAPSPPATLVELGPSSTDSTVTFQDFSVEPLGGQPIYALSIGGTTVQRTHVRFDNVALEADSWYDPTGLLLLAPKSSAPLVVEDSTFTISNMPFVGRGFNNFEAIRIEGSSTTVPVVLRNVAMNMTAIEFDIDSLHDAESFSLLRASSALLLGTVRFYFTDIRGLIIAESVDLFRTSSTTAGDGADVRVVFSGVDLELDGGQDFNVCDLDVVASAAPSVPPSVAIDMIDSKVASTVEYDRFVVVDFWTSGAMRSAVRFDGFHLTYSQAVSWTNVLLVYRTETAPSDYVAPPASFPYDNSVVVRRTTVDAPQLADADLMRVRVESTAPTATRIELGAGTTLALKGSALELDSEGARHSYDVVLGSTPSDLQVAPLEGGALIRVDGNNAISIAVEGAATIGGGTASGATAVSSVIAFTGFASTEASVTVARDSQLVFTTTADTPGAAVVDFQTSEHVAFMMEGSVVSMSGASPTRVVALNSAGTYRGTVSVLESTLSGLSNMTKGVAASEGLSPCTSKHTTMNGEGVDEGRLAAEFLCDPANVTAIPPTPAPETPAPPPPPPSTTPATAVPGTETQAPGSTAAALGGGADAAGRGSDQNTESDGGPGAAVVVSSVVVPVALLAVAGVALAYLYRRRSRQRQQALDKEMEEAEAVPPTDADANAPHSSRDPQTPSSAPTPTPAARSPQADGCVAVQVAESVNPATPEYDAPHQQPASDDGAGTLAPSATAPAQQRVPREGKPREYKLPRVWKAGGKVA